MQAKLVQDKTRNGFRAIVQHDESKNTFYPSHPNTEQWVEVVEATQENIKPYLKNILEELGLKNIVIEDTTKLMDKFYKELATYPLVKNKLKGSLAYNETSTKETFFLIIG
jgi:hypothetical protein